MNTRNIGRTSMILGALGSGGIWNMAGSGELSHSRVQC
jgi:hypothetical protein